jgi:hypothetical protein
MIGLDHPATLFRSLIEAIARSPIVFESAKSPVRDFAGWCKQQNGDLDAVILNWLRSEAAHRATH